MKTTCLNARHLYLPINSPLRTSSNISYTSVAACVEGTEERSSRQKIIKGAALKEVFTTFFMWGFVPRPAAAADRGQFRQLGICPHSEGRSKNGKFSIWMGCWLGWAAGCQPLCGVVTGYRHGGNLPRKKSLQHWGLSLVTRGHYLQLYVYIYLKKLLEFQL